MFLPITFFQDAFKHIDEVTLSPTDLGFQRGYSIFDFFKLKQLENPWIDWYLERLQLSSSSVGITLPYSNSELKKITLQLFQKNKIEDGYVKIIVSAGNSDNGYSPQGPPTLLLLGLPITPPDRSLYEYGANLITTEYQRDIPHIKSTNYMQSAMLAKQMKKEKAVDVLYYKDNLITETSRCNFYIIKNNKIHTSGCNILKGITRRRILANSNNPLPIIESDLHITYLKEATEAFISSTTKGIMPITSIGKQPIGTGSVGVITKEMMKQINDF